MPPRKQKQGFQVKTLCRLCYPAPRAFQRNIRISPKRKLLMH